MEKLEYYQSGEEYLAEMLGWIKNWIRLYRNYAVFLDEDGSLIQIKGAITYGSDLELSLEGGMSPEEQASYEAEAEKLREELEHSQKRAANSFQRGIAIPLEYLFRVFDLSKAERFCVLMSVSVEYDRTMGRMFSLLQNDYKEVFPTLDLCLRIYTGVEKYRFAERARMLSAESNVRYFLQAPFENSRDLMKIHPRIQRFLLNFQEEDKLLAGIASLVFADEKERPFINGDDHQIDQMERAAYQEGSKNVCFLYGPAGVGKKTMVSQVTVLRHQPVLFIDMRRLDQEKSRREGLLEDLIRELVIRGASPCCFHFEILQPGEEDTKEEILRKEADTDKLIRRLLSYSNHLFLTSEKKWEGEWNRPDIARTDWEIPFPSMAEQLGIWEKLTENIQIKGATPQSLVIRFSLTPGKMAEALREALDKCIAKGEPVLSGEELYRACRRQLVMHLGSHVTRIKTQYTWADLILPKQQKKALISACNQVEFQHQVYDVWGFNSKVAYGKGVSMLFYGPPGTGKTMAAQVIANQLSMELYKVDLSSVMSKYIGETEKNLGKIFDEVKKSRSILFFDEADALFGKRTEVKDAHDKYANAETAYLLQKIEEYQGIVVLATNYMQNFDEAFKRRIKFIIEFPFPLPQYRLQMWKNVFPDKMPLEDLDYDYLAETFELSGSSIKNSAVASAFLAASAGCAVGMKQILLALKDEMIKSGKSMPPESFGEYYDLICDLS